MGIGIINERFILLHAFLTLKRSALFMYKCANQLFDISKNNWKLKTDVHVCCSNKIIQSVWFKTSRFTRNFLRSTSERVMERQVSQRSRRLGCNSYQWFPQCELHASCVYAGVRRTVRFGMNLPRHIFNTLITNRVPVAVSGNRKKLTRQKCSLFVLSKCVVFR